MKQSEYSGIILASKSPRRKELLRLLGLPFKVVFSDIDEKKYYHLKPEKRAQKLALMKTKEVAKKYPKAIIISADSFGVFNGKTLEKAESKKEAFNMLRTLSDKTHQLITGYAVYDPKKKKYQSGFNKADVVFHKLKKSEIEDYLATKEFEGKAPPYTINGKGIFMIKKIDGSYHTVAGLPLEKIVRILIKIGVKLF